MGTHERIMLPKLAGEDRKERAKTAVAIPASAGPKREEFDESEEQGPEDFVRGIESKVIALGAFQQFAADIMKCDCEQTMQTVAMVSLIGSAILKLRHGIFPAPKEEKFTEYEKHLVMNLMEKPTTDLLYFVVLLLDTTLRAKKEDLQ